MIITSLKIENWKNFQEGHVTLGNRLFLVGPNASGKSNFLDIFRFLRDLSVSGGGLRQAVDVRRGGVSTVRCLAARRRSDIVIDVTMGEDSDTWRYRLSFNQNNNRQAIVKEELVEHKGDVILMRPDKKDKEDPLLLTETFLEQISANQRFRPVVSFFQSISYQHLLPQVIRDPLGFSPGRVDNDPFGRDFLQRVESTPKKSRDSRLHKILNVLRSAVPQINDLRVSRDPLGVPHLEGVFEYWRPGAGKQNEAQFSDGTLRLIGLLWTLFEGDGPLLMEEPELSLHGEIVGQLPQIIERVNRNRRTRRQVIISTHSEEMLSDKGIGGEEILRLEPSSEGTLLKSPVDDPEEKRMLESGLSAADVVLPKSRPYHADQLALLLDQ